MKPTKPTPTPPRPQYPPAKDACDVCQRNGITPGKHSECRKCGRFTEWAKNKGRA